jgi:outer membrane protein assembly factor BamB
MATAAYHDGVVYVVANDGTSGGGAGAGTSGPARSAAYALDAGTGEVIWKVAVGSGCFGAVTYSNGLVLFPTIDGTAHALNAADGAELWTTRPGLPLAGGISVSDGLLYVGHGWTWSPNAPVPGGLVAYGP